MSDYEVSIGMRSSQIEKGIIATIFYDPSKIKDIADLIDESHFQDGKCRKIFKICKDLSEDDSYCDSAIVRAKSGEDLYQTIDEISLLDPLSSNIEDYIEQLKGLKTLIDLRTLSTSIVKETSNTGQVSHAEILDMVERSVLEISIQNTSTNFRHIKDISTSILKIIENQKRDNKAFLGLDTGYPLLTRQLNGLNDGDLIIIGARPGMGKTALALNIAHSVVIQGHGVAFFSLEMPSEQLIQRMICAKADIPLQALRLGDISDMDALTKSVDDISKQELYVDDYGALNISQLRSKLRRLKMQKPHIKLAIIDYLQLMRGKNSERHLEIGEISRGLKILARELKIPIIALSQLNRNIDNRENKRPMLSDLRESGSIEQDADIIMFIHNKEESSAKKEDSRSMRSKPQPEIPKPLDIIPVEVIVAKNRNGATGQIHMKFNKKYVRFEMDRKPSEENPELKNTEFYNAP